VIELAILAREHMSHKFTSWTRHEEWSRITVATFAFLAIRRTAGWQAMVHRGHEVSLGWGDTREDAEAICAAWAQETAQGFLAALAPNAWPDIAAALKQAGDAADATCADDRMPVLSAYLAVARAIDTYPGKPTL